MPEANTNPELIQAIQNNKEQDVLKFIQKKSVEPGEAALKAIELGSLNVLKSIVANYSAANSATTPLNLSDPQNTYLIAACTAGNVEIITYLVKEAGVNPNTNQYGYSPVSAAANASRKDIITLLENLGANLRENEHNTLYLLAKNDNLPMMKYLVEELKFDLHADEEIALRTASKNGHHEIVAYLVDNGADLSNIGSVALSLAVTNNHFDMAAKYVEAGVDWSFLEEEKDSLKQIADAIKNEESEYAQNLITHLVMHQLDS